MRRAGNRTPADPTERRIGKHASGNSIVTTLPLYKDGTIFYTLKLGWNKGGCWMNDPRQHVNEEPRNDFLDVGVGFLGMFGFLLLIAVIFTIIEVAGK